MSMWETNSKPHSTWRQHSSGGGAAILLYHRVTKLDADPQLLAVSPQHFDEHMVFLRRHATPLSLTEFLAWQRDGRIPERAVVVTFDDGYADNLETAKPILERHDVPATVFVTSSGLDGEREFWWDDIERLLLATSSHPVSDVEVSAGGATVHIPAGSYEPCSRNAAWSVLQHEAPTSRHEAYRAVCTVLQPLPAAVRRELVEGIEAALGLSPCVRDTHRSMTPEMLKRLAEGGLIEVGAHTLTHSLLAAMPPQDQRREIVEGKRMLEEVLGMPVRSFSYPFGGSRDYTAETVNLVRLAGFECACANVAGLATAAGDPWQLPRMLVRDWSADEFAARFESFWRCHEPLAARSAS